MAKVSATTISTRAALDDLGIVMGTDKSSLRMDYLAQYERMLGCFRDETFFLVEIGVYNGASLRTWQAYFSKATIVGVDIAPSCLAHVSDRIVVEIGAQEDRTFMSRIARQYPPTIVIDDGSHRSDHIISSFEQLFPGLKRGGCYIIEDLHGQGHDRSRDGASPVSAAEYFGLIANQHLVARLSMHPHSEVQRYCFDNIERIEFLRGSIALWKNRQPDSMPDLSRIRQLVKRSGHVENLLYLSEYLDRQMGALAEALKVARRGAATAPDDPWFQLRISEVLEKQGDFAGCVTAAKRAVALAPGQPIFGQFLEALEARLSAARGERR